MILILSTTTAERNVPTDRLFHPPTAAPKAAKLAPSIGGLFTHMAAAFLAFAHLKKKERSSRFFVSRPAFTAGAAEAAGAGSILMGR